MDCVWHHIRDSPISIVTSHKKQIILQVQLELQCACEDSEEHASEESVCVRVKSEWVGVRVRRDGMTPRSCTSR
jgi:hypothetical protein